MYVCECAHISYTHTHTHTHTHEEDNGKFKHRSEAKKLASDLGFVSEDATAVGLGLDTPNIVV